MKAGGFLSEKKFPANTLSAKSAGSICSSSAIVLMANSFFSTEGRSVFLGFVVQADYGERSRAVRLPTVLGFLCCEFL